MDRCVSVGTKTPVRLDNSASGAYVSVMLIRLVSALAALAIVVVTTAGSAHVARMGNVPDLGAHAVRMMQLEGGCAVPCAGDEPCDPAMAGLCGFASVGFTGMVSSPSAQADFVFHFIGRIVAPDLVLSGLLPELAERPPKNRLV